MTVDSHAGWFVLVTATLVFRTFISSESSLSCYPTSGQSSSRTTTFPAASYSNYANLSGNIQKNNLSSVKLEYTAWKPIDIWPFPLPAPCSCQLLGWVPWKPFPSLLLNRKVGVCVSMCVCFFFMKVCRSTANCIKKDVFMCSNCHDSHGGCSVWKVIWCKILSRVAHGPYCTDEDTHWTK